MRCSVGTRCSCPCAGAEGLPTRFLSPRLRPEGEAVSCTEPRPSSFSPCPLLPGLCVRERNSICVYVLCESFN